MSEDLFPGLFAPGAPKAKKLSPDRARTQRAVERLKRGVHPLTLLKLRQPMGESCGSCGHCRTKSYAGTYFKCALWKDSKGPGTDLRKKWPACEKWVAR